jgi:hypothetical protein
MREEQIKLHVDALEHTRASRMYTLGHTHTCIQTQCMSKCAFRQNAHCAPLRSLRSVPLYPRCKRVCVCVCVCVCLCVCVCVCVSGLESRIRVTIIYGKDTLLDASVLSLSLSLSLTHTHTLETMFTWHGGAEVNDGVICAKHSSRVAFQSPKAGTRTCLLLSFRGQGTTCT